MKTIETISIPVSNQEKSKEFYVSKLGFEVIFEAEAPDGGKWIQLGIADDTTSITLVSGAMHAKAGSIKGTIIGTDDIGNDIERLRNKGVEVEDVQDFPHGKISSFSDPDGNQWVLRQAPSYN